MAFVRGTVNTPGVSLIVALSMECECVAAFFPASLTSGRARIDFHHLSILEMPFAPATFSGLFL